MMKPSWRDSLKRSKKHGMRKNKIIQAKGRHQNQKKSIQNCRLAYVYEQLQLIATETLILLRVQYSWLLLWLNFHPTCSRQRVFSWNIKETWRESSQTQEEFSEKRCNFWRQIPLTFQTHTNQRSSIKVQPGTVPVKKIWKHEFHDACNCCTKSFSLWSSLQLLVLSSWMLWLRLMSLAFVLA